MSNINIPSAIPTGGQDLNVNLPQVAPIDQSQMWQGYTDVLMQKAQEYSDEYLKNTVAEAQARQTDGTAIETPWYLINPSSRQAFEQGRNQVYLDQKNYQLESTLSKLYKENMYDPEKYIQSVDSFKKDFMYGVPTNMSGQIATKLNGAILSTKTKIDNNVYTKNLELNKAYMAESIDRDIQSYATQVSQGEMDEMARLKYRQDFAQKTLTAVKNNLIEPQQLYKKLQEFESESIVANHIYNLRGMSADQQQQYIANLEKTHIQADGSQITVDNYMDGNIGSEKQKEYVISKLKQRNAETTQNENAEVRQATDGLYRIRADIESGNSYNVDEYNRYIATLQRVDPSGSYNKIKEMQSLANAQNRIFSEVVVNNDLNSLNQRMAELTYRIDQMGSAGGENSVQDKIVLDLMRRKVEKMNNQIETGYVPSASTVLPSGNEPKMPVETRKNEISKFELQSGKKAVSYYTPEDESKLIDMITTTNNDPDKINTAKKLFSAVPAEYKQGTINSIAKRSPFTAITLEIGEYAHTNPVANDLHRAIVRGSVEKDGNDANDVKMALKNELLSLAPNLGNNPDDINGATQVAYQAFKGANGLGNAQVIARQILGFSTNPNQYKINGAITVPFIYGLSPEKNQQIYNNISVNDMARRENGMPFVVRPDGVKMALNDNAKSRLKLNYIGQNSYELSYIAGTTILPVYNATTGQPFKYKYMEQDMYNLTSNTPSISDTSGVPNIIPDSPQMTQNISPGRVINTGQSPITNTGNVNVYNAFTKLESGDKNIGYSVDGAYGKYQITPDTFNRFAIPGESLQNPQDNERVGRRIIDSYLARYNGDLSRAAVAYFSGEGNVAPPGSALPYKNDYKDGTGTSVSKYVGIINANYAKLSNQGQVQTAFNNNGGTMTDYYLQAKRNDEIAKEQRNLANDITKSEVDVKLTNEKNINKENLDSAVKYIDAIRTDSGSAEQLANQANLLADYYRTGSKTFMGMPKSSGLVEGLTNTIGAFTGTMEEQQKFIMNSGQQILQNLSQLKGSASDKEGAFIKSISVGLGKTPEANKQGIAGMSVISDRLLYKNNIYKSLVNNPLYQNDQVKMKNEIERIYNQTYGDLNLTTEQKRYEKMLFSPDKNNPLAYNIGDKMAITDSKLYDLPNGKRISYKVGNISYIAQKTDKGFILSDIIAGN